MTHLYSRGRAGLSWRLGPVVAAALFATSCGAGKPIEGGLASPPAEYVALVLSPSRVTIDPLASADFFAEAELSDGSQNPATGVSFTATGGTIDASGHYTAGGTAGTFRVIASLAGRADTSTVVISAFPSRTLTALSITPSTAALLAGGTQSFTAVGVLGDGSDSTVTVAWSATGGTIDANGLYTAPSQTGNYRVIARLQGGTLADTAQVTVTTVPATLAAVVLTPPTAALQYTQTQQFTAVGQLSDGSTTPLAVTWSATGGTISSSGAYKAGSTAGTFRVIARAANGMADTSSVAVTAPTVTSLTLTPATVSLIVGSAVQFSVSARMSNGTTQTNPSVLYTATGGTITTGGLYTAGATTGTFRVIAAASNGVADTSTVTLTPVPPPPPGGLYPNLPAGYSNTSELDFSQIPPSGGNDGIDTPIAGAPAGWNMIFYGTNWSRITDSTAQQSPPGVWRGVWPAGSYGGGVIGQGGGHGIGNVFTYAADGTTRLYISVRVYFDFDPSQWHPISNKFINLEANNSQILMQLNEGGNWRHAEELSNSGGNFYVDNGVSVPGEAHLPGQVSNIEVPTRRWTHIEVQIDIPNHIYRIWQDGVLTTDARPNFASSTISTVGFYAFRGGGGETLTTPLYWRYDHFFIAW